MTEPIQRAIEVSGVKKCTRVSLRDHEQKVYSGCEKYRLYLEGIDAGLYVMVSRTVSRAYVSTCAETYLGTELLSVLFVFIEVLNRELKSQAAL